LSDDHGEEKLACKFLEGFDGGLRGLAVFTERPYASKE